jgi:hypothetical protein
MISKVHAGGALLAIVGCFMGGCVGEGGTAVGDDSRHTASVVFEGVTYSPREFAALGVSAAHFVSTVESARNGMVYAFATPIARDAFVERMPKPELAPSFNRNNSKFYEDPSYDKKLLEVGVGESVLNLGTHPCNCNQMISSIKASQDARWTKIYDAVDLNPDFGEWWIASGAEISNLALFDQLNETAADDDVTWVNDASSIQVTD